MKKIKARIKFAKRSPVNLVGHLDTMEFIKRALRRAGWPLKFTSGYNPRIKLTSMFPLSLGFYSEAEYIDIYLNFYPGDYQIQKFKVSTVKGLKIKKIAILPADEKGINKEIEGVRYRLEVKNNLPEKFIQKDEVRKLSAGILKLDIPKISGGIKNPRKYIPEKYLKKVVRTECIWKKVNIGGKND
ncbi:MAG: TIGR03936 family radical SAM-associated protein [Elusimicrobiota bacterium]